MHLFSFYRTLYHVKCIKVDKTHGNNEEAICFKLAVCQTNFKAVSIFFKLAVERREKGKF